MNKIGDIFNTPLNYMSTIGLSDIIDILIVAFLIYYAIMFIRRTNSYNLAKGLAVFVLALLLSGVFKLEMINYVLKSAVELGLVAVLILFQPELRKMLERMGSSFSSSKVSGTEAEKYIAQIILSCKEMSAARTGALIILERNMKLNEIMSTGTIINANITAELIKNIFYNKAPLHDGAMIVRDGRIAAAGCVLPLSKNTSISKDLGMRHRAGIGISEQADAVVIIVSEETGSISVAVEGLLKRHLTAATLDKLLRQEMINDEDESSGLGFLGSIRKLFKVKMNEEDERI